MTMPRVNCPECGLSTYCVREEECPRCGRLLRAPSRRYVTGADPIQRALALVREQLRVNVSFVSEIVDGREVVRHAAGDGSLPGFVAGAALPLADTICERLLAGRIGHIVPDVAAEPALADLTWPAQIGVNAYLGVPITAMSTRMYLLCCLARERRPDLAAVDVEFLRSVAASLRDHLAGPAGA
jgi:GAF domain-containing protein